MTYAIDNRMDWEMESEMNILFYARNGAAKGLEETIGALPLEVELYRNASDLMERLRHPLHDPAIAVLVAESRQCLEELLVLRHLFRNARIILILPDRESSTISKGHGLHARFLSYIDSDPAEVALVLGKMVEKAKSPAYKGLIG
jgi:hypothetical protein